MRWPKYWSFSFSISPFNEHPELISKEWSTVNKDGNFSFKRPSTIIEKVLGHLKQNKTKQNKNPKGECRVEKQFNKKEKILNFIIPYWNLLKNFTGLQSLTVSCSSLNFWQSQYKSTLTTHQHQHCYSQLTLYQPWGCQVHLSWSFTWIRIMRYKKLR